jgi:outer membrane protein assembly factor BamA
VIFRATSSVVGALLCFCLSGEVVRAQEQTSRAEAIAQAQAEKARQLRPYVPGKVEQYLNRTQQRFVGGLGFHPYFRSAYSGGGFTLGAGYRASLSPYNTLDFRGSYTFKNYKRLEGEFFAPRLLKRQGQLSVVGGWREATQVGYYGLGTSTDLGNRANYGFEQLYGLATIGVRPRRTPFAFQAGVETSRWDQKAGSGSAPSIDDVYTPETLPGLGATVSYLHSHATLGIDTRANPGYARRGGSYSVTFRDFSDVDDAYGFTQVDYEAVQHIPVLRETWVLSFRGAASTTGLKQDQQIPFFMLPAIGGGSSLRGYNSWRFRDRNSLLVQAEWRVMVNRYFDTAVFYDAGKVAAEARDLNLKDLRDDYGIGFRFHGPFSTPLRIDFAHGREGLSINFGSSAAF